MIEKQPDCMKANQIYESLDGLTEGERSAEVLKQLMELYPERGGQYFIWWVQSRDDRLSADE